MSSAPKADDVVVGIELHSGMPADLPQTKLAAVYTNNLDAPSQDDPLPSTEQIPIEDSSAAAAPTLALPTSRAPPTTWPTNPLAPDNNASAPKDDNTSDSKQQNTALCGSQELKEQDTAALKHAAYQSAAIEIQTLLATLQTRRDSISEDDLNTVHRSFDSFMSLHPVLSKGYIEARKAEQAAICQMQGPMGAAAVPPSVDGRGALPTQMPPNEQQTLTNGSLENLLHTSLLDPNNLCLQGATALASNGGVVGSLDLLQDVAAAYRYQMMQSPETDSAGNLCINKLRNHLLDKANIDSSAVEVLQQLSAGGGGGGSASTRSRGGRSEKVTDVADVFADKVRQKPRRRAPAPSCEDLAGSALISLGGGNQQEKDKPGLSSSVELEKDRSIDVEKTLRLSPLPSVAAAACGIKRACPIVSNSSVRQDSTTRKRRYK